MKKLRFNKIKKSIPNILTTLRLGAVPIFWGLTLSGNFIPAAILFGSACITDALDGFLARHWKVESVYGKIVDPLADKLLVMSALLLNSITANPLMILPFILESAISIVNLKDFSRGINFKNLFKISYIKNLVSNNNKKEINKRVKVSQTGREKTVALMTTVSLGLILPYQHLINLLILFTSTIESATFVEYLDAKILNKDDSNMKLPNFTQKEFESNNIKEIEKTKSICILKKEEQIDYLNKEKEKLLEESKIKELEKTKRLHL